MNVSNRNQLVIAGVALTVIFFLAAALTAGILLVKRTNNADAVSMVMETSTLAYCHDGQERPCVVSFGADAHGSMVVNILVSGGNYPLFTLQITHNNKIVHYECQQTSSLPNTVFCTGEQMPPGETLHLALISTEDQTVLADGDLSILGLAFPTLGVVTQTAMPTETLTPTMTPIGINTPAVSQTPTPPVSYP